MSRVEFLLKISVVNHHEKSLDPEGCSQLLTLSILSIVCWFVCSLVGLLDVFALGIWFDCL